jgi:tetratricopeptide (TPR) repeat protein
LHDRQQEFAQAEKLYRQAAAVDPKSALVHNDLGLCYARQKRLGEAQQSLEVAVKLQPLNKMYRNNLATVLMESGRQEEAWTHLVAVNEPAVAHYNMAFLLHQRKQDDAAAQHLHSALQIDGSLSPAAQLLAKIEGRTGTTEELVIEEPSGDMPSYSISDEPVVESPSGEHVMVANSGPGELVNPLAPATRRSATYRMPPTEEQAIDPAPRPTRLPEAPQAEYAEEVELAPPGVDDDFPARRIAHEEEVELRQPKNVIKLLGELEAAPTPEE